MDTDTVVTETLSQAVARQAAEIERLREVESNTTAAMIEWEKRWRSTAQENERLRKDFSDLLRVAANDASEHQAEIERLRDHVKFLNSFRPDAELAKRDAEIERLRLQVKMIPLPEYRDDPRLQEIIEEQRAEIERLRGLLRWHLNWMHDDHSDEEMEKWDDYMEDWEKRVREALGDD